MLNRRVVLRAGAVATASGVAGCAVLDGEPAGEPARFGRGATAPANPRVVALDETRAGDESKGVLEASAAAFERDDGRLVVVSFHRVLAGATSTGSDWRYSAVRATHDWSAMDGAVTASETNTTTIDADSPDVRFRLASESDNRSRSWRVVLPEPSAQSVAYRFRTTYRPASVPSDGDAFATIASESKLTDGGLLFGTERVDATLDLVYGDATRDD